MFSLVVIGFVGLNPWPVAGRVLLSGVSEEHCQEVLDAMKGASNGQPALVAVCASDTPLESFTFNDGTTLED